MASASPYLKAALLTLALVFLGFFIISQLDAMRAGELRASVEQMAFESESERLLFLYAQTMGNSTGELCGFMKKSIESRASKASGLAEKIRYYEQGNVVNTEYEQIKGQYYLANAALYLNMMAVEKYCGTSQYIPVLFFYKVNEECAECKAQGGVLDNVGAKYPNMRVFAFPSDTDNEFINVFLARHSITSSPSIVIDDRIVLLGLQNEADVEKYLGPAGQG